MTRTKQDAHHGRRSLLALALATVALTGGIAAPAATGDPRPTPSATAPTTAPVQDASPAIPVKVAPTAVVPDGPVWFPLRRNLSGTEVKVGCTFDSHGSRFGYECSGHHDRWALDLIAEAGTPVYASGPGFATNGTGAAGGSGYGNNVRIDHGGGVQTIYAHLSKVLVPAEGVQVDQNTVIGLVGSTGSSSANHLHYERRLVGAEGRAEPVDPGPLYACTGGTVVSYPQARGVESWKGISWGAFTMASDGTDCATSAALAPSAGRLADRLPSDFLVMALADLARRPSEP
ncbi:hypothetical protein BH10ACT1_BH10ACT1_32750 [soil metagenome]